MSNSKYEILLFAFLDSATAPLTRKKLDSHLKITMAQFFYLGVVDFLRQAENLDERTFLVLIARVFERYAIPLNMPVQQFLESVTRNIEENPTLEQFMTAGAESFKRFWVEEDATAPIEFEVMISLIDYFNNEYENTEEDIPREYYPWLREIVPFVNSSLNSVDRKRFNKDDNGNARVLLGGCPRIELLRF
mgnify:CR=1 FL=1